MAPEQLESCERNVTLEHRDSMTNLHGKALKWLTHSRDTSFATVSLSKVPIPSRSGSTTLFVYHDFASTSKSSRQWIPWCRIGKSREWNVTLESVKEWLEKWIKMVEKYRELSHEYLAEQRWSTNCECHQGVQHNCAHYAWLGLVDGTFDNLLVSPRQQTGSVTQWWRHSQEHWLLIHDR